MKFKYSKLKNLFAHKNKKKKKLPTTLINFFLSYFFTSPTSSLGKRQKTEVI